MGVYDGDDSSDEDIFSAMVYSAYDGDSEADADVGRMSEVIGEANPAYDFFGEESIDEEAGMNEDIARELYQAYIPPLEHDGCEPAWEMDVIDCKGEWVPGSFATHGTLNDGDSSDEGEQPAEDHDVRVPVLASSLPTRRSASTSPPAPL